MKGESPLYPQQAWDEGYQSLRFEKVAQNDHVRQWLEHWARKSRGKCFEAGCFPGRYLTIFGDQGYELSGIDATPRIADDMAKWLKSEGYSTGQLEQGDFFALDRKAAYDVVYSVGFLEHFPNWKEVIAKHAELVRPEGLLLLVAPNFAGGLQKFFHERLDPINTSRHYLPSMDPELWRVEVERMGFEVLETSYFPEFDFWVGEEERSLAQKLAFYGLRSMIPILKRALPKNQRFSSPYCGLAARRKR